MLNLVQQAIRIAVIACLMVFSACVSETPRINQIEEPFRNLQVIFNPSIQEIAHFEAEYSPLFQSSSNEALVSKSQNMNFQLYMPYLIEHAAPVFIETARNLSGTQFTAARLMRANPIIQAPWWNQAQPALFIQVSRVFSKCALTCVPMYDFYVYVIDRQQVVWRTQIKQPKARNVYLTKQPTAEFIIAVIEDLAKRALMQLIDDGAVLVAR